MSFRLLPRYFSHFIVVAISACIVGCGPEAPDPLIGYSGQAHWESATLPAPVMSAGDGMEKSIWNDPSVLFESGTYVM